MKSIGDFSLRWQMLLAPLLLILAIVCMVPGIGTVAAFLLAFPAAEMMLDRDSPRLPRFLTARPIPTRHFTRWAARADYLFEHWDIGTTNNLQSGIFSPQIVTVGIAYRIPFRPYNPH